MEDKPLEYMQLIFADTFIFANRLQTACEKIQTEITIKQWLLLALIENIDGENNLTNIGNIMGCSRQNVKKLATPLKEKGYITFTHGSNNALGLELTDRFYEYAKAMGSRHLDTLTLLFEDFSRDELKQLFLLYDKLFAGLEKIERYGENIK